MFHRYVFRALLAAMLCVFCGCSGARGIQLRPKDRGALGRVYQSSGWTFRPLTVQLQVRAPGAVLVMLDGEATHRRNSEEPLWIPIALARDAPEYFRNETGGSPVELESYAVDGGLWCLTAVLRDVPRSTASPEGAARVRFQILLVSPKYESELPLVLPAGSNDVRGRADVAVSLPVGGRFTSSRITTIGASGNDPAQLAAVPAAASAGAATVTQSLEIGETIAWDFSTVRFLPPSPLLRPWFWPAVSLIICMAGALFFRQMQIRFAERIAADYAIALLRAETTFHQASFESSGKGFSEIYMLEVRELRRLLITEAAIRTKRQLYRRADELIGLAHGAPAERHGLREFGRFWRSRRVVEMLLVIAVASLIALLASLARGQSRANAVREPAVRYSQALEDMKIAVDPSDPNSSDSNGVNVSLAFYPVTDRPNPGTQEIGIGTAQNLEIKAISVEQPSGATVRLEHDYFIVSVPHAYSDWPRRMITLAEFSNSYSLDPAYESSRTSGVSLKYRVVGAQSPDRYWRWKWLYKFPYDQVRVELALRFREPIIMYQLNVGVLMDQYGSPGISGVPVDFVATDNGYRGTIRTAARRYSVWPGHEVVIHAGFHRSLFQRWLPVLLLLLAPFVGLLVGWAATAGKEHWLFRITAAFGLPSAAALTIFAVFAGRKDTPTLMSGGGRTSVLEIAYISAAIIALFVAVVRAKKSSYHAEPEI